MTNKTCETCQAFAREDITGGSCKLSPESYPVGMDRWCMQHIPIEAECDSDDVKYVETLERWAREQTVKLATALGDKGELNKRLHVAFSAMRQACDEIEKGEPENLLSSVMLLQRAIELVKPTMKPHPVDDHSLEAKLKEAHEELGKANGRVKELESFLDNDRNELDDLRRNIEDCHETLSEFDPGQIAPLPVVDRIKRLIASRDDLQSQLANAVEAN